MNAPLSIKQVSKAVLVTVEHSNLPTMIVPALFRSSVTIDIHSIQLFITHWNLTSFAHFTVNPGAP